MININQKILHVLRNASDYVSGQHISQMCHVTRASIWKHIQALRLSGYDIEAKPHRGYKLISCVDRLTQMEVQTGLTTKVFGQRVYFFDSVSSTMDEAFQLASKKAHEGDIIIAETQTKGRGRLGRHWESLKHKGIYFSLILKPQCSLQHVAGITLVGAVAVSEAIETLTGVRAFIKWPNDLLINNKKLCGILTEMRADLDRVNYVVLGIGINVNHQKEHLLPEAISLKQVLRSSVSRVHLLQEILKALEYRYEQFQQGDFKLILKAWKKRTATLGKQITFFDGQHLSKGIAVDIDQDGALIVKLPNGKMIRRVAGDVAHG